jgi:hypothetical protein
MIVIVSPRPLAPVSSMLRQVVMLTLATLTRPVQAGSQRNALHAANAERLRAQEWAVARRELRVGDHEHRDLEPAAPRGRQE